MSKNQNKNSKKPRFSKKEVAQSKVDQQLKNPEAGMRLNKYISNAGICSRRDADIYIQAGSVTVNGKAVTELGYKVKLNDDVRFDGRRISPEPKAYVLLNKPKGFFVTGSYEQNNKTVMDLVASASKSRISPIGKLETSATGLVLFTNDGTLAKKLTGHKKGVRQLYQLELDKQVNEEHLEEIKKGPFIEGKKVIIEDAAFVENKPHHILGIELKSQRSHIVQRIFKKFGYEIIKMDRVVYANLDKKNLPRGHYRHLTKQEVINLGMV
ncbi:MAG: rRNA pseudouridine synthase [Flavobacteriaceae bacterium]|nr:rRNA pseudouridine synthase [Flavobacteriaceae bacterium]